MVAGIGGRDAASLEAAGEALAAAGVEDVQRRGLELFGVVHVVGIEDRRLSATARVAKLEEIAAQHRVIAAGSLIPNHRPDVAAALAVRASSEEIERLWVRFKGEEDAASFARTLGGTFRQVGERVIIESRSIGARTGYMAQRRGGLAELVAGDVMRLALWVSRGKPKAFDSERVAAELVAYLRPYLGTREPIHMAANPASVSGYVETPHPGEVLAAAAAFAGSRGFELWSSGHPRDRLVDAIAHVASDLAAARSGRP
jgi:hypothetical protein